MFTKIVQYSSLVDLIMTFSDEQKCIDYLEALRWNGDVVSPFDASSKVYKCKNNKYRCKNTGKYFNVKTGTIFEDSKIPLQKWFCAIYLIANHKKGISSHQIARDLNVTQKTGWFLLHRIREAFSYIENQLSNVVEADETYVGGKNRYKHASKKIKGGGHIGKETVAGAMERGGNVVAKHIENSKTLTIQTFVQENVIEGASLMTDENYAYKALNGKYKHKYVRHMNDTYAVGDVHTNSIEGFWSHFKRGIYGIYHQVSKKHLQRYINEYTFRYNTRKVADGFRFNMTLTRIERRLKYKDLIAWKRI